MLSPLNKSQNKLLNIYAERGKSFYCLHFFALSLLFYGSYFFYMDF